MLTDNERKELRNELREDLVIKILFYLLIASILSNLFFL